MKKNIFTILALMAALCACNKEQATKNDNETPVIFTAIMEGADTKVTLAADGLTPSWEIGDSIRINKSKIYRAQNAGTSSIFWPTEQSASGPSFEALFPASYMVQWGPSNPVMFFPPDESYPWVDGDFRMPMYAKSDNNELHFKNLCGVLRITVKDHLLDSVKRVRVYNPDKLMFGTFKVNSDTGAMELTDPSDPAQAEGLRMRSVIYGQSVLTLEESKTFYIALAPQQYGHLRIDLSEDGETFPYQLRTMGSVTIERNKIYNVDYSLSGATEYLTIIPEEVNNDDFE